MEIKKTVHMLVLMLIPVGFFMMAPGMGDEGYGELVEYPFLGDLGVETARTVVLVATIAAGLLFYRAGEDDNMSFLVALLILLSPYAVLNCAFANSVLSAVSFFLVSAAFFVFMRVNKYGAVVPLVLALLVYHSFDISVENLAFVGLVLPLSAITLVKREKLPVTAFVIGLILSFVSPVYALVFLAYSGNCALKRFSDELDEKLFWFVGLFFLAFYLILPFTIEKALESVLVAAALTAVLYLVLSLYKINAKKYLYIVLAFFVALALGNSFMKFHIDSVSTPSEYIVEAYKMASGKVGIVEFGNAFEYYTGEEGIMLTEGDFLESKKLGVDYVVLSSSGLYNELENKSVAFRIISIGTDEQGKIVGVFINRNYVMYVPLDADLEVADDGSVQDRRTGMRSSVPFTKLKKFNEKLPFTDSSNLLINTRNIEDSNLYSMLTSETVYEEGDVKMIKVE